MSLRRFCDRCQKQIGDNSSVSPGKVLLEVRATLYQHAKNVERELCQPCTTVILSVIMEKPDDSR